MPPVVLQHHVTPGDCAWIYNIRIPPISKPDSVEKGTEGEKIPIKFVSVTQKEITLTILHQSTNRVLASDSPSKFIGISFANLRFEEQPASVNSSYVERLLNTGIVLNGMKYLFYGHSNSQLKSKTCYLFAARDGTEITKKINSFGDFSNIMSVAKRAKRIGLLFSAAESQVQLDQRHTADIEDVEHKGHIFTDGCGLISKSYAAELARRRNIIFHNKRYVPSVFQIRYKGYKGTVMLHQKLSKKIHFRESMGKFKNCPDNTFSVLDYAKPFAFGYLNAELVTLLSTLDISDEIILKKQKEYFQFIRKASTDPKTAFEFLAYKGDMEHAEKVLLDGLSKMILAKIKKLQRQEWEGCYKNSVEKVRIMIPESRLLYGVSDYTGILKEGEVHVRIEVETMGIRSLDTAEIIVGRNPCLHPGDIRKFKVVQVQELNHLSDCIVFPVKGERDAPSLMSGGDLDGDRFFVCWDKELIPEKLYEAYGYPPAKETPRREITYESMIKYFSNYSNASLGRVKNLYLEWLRVTPDLAGSTQCQELNALFSCCVDGEKINIPDHLQNPPKRAEGSAPFILDALTNEVKNNANQIFQTEPEFVEVTSLDGINFLLTSEDICMNEFEIFQLINRWCLRNNVNIERFLSHFDFGAFTLAEKQWISSQIKDRKVREKYLGLIFNNLSQSNLVILHQLKSQFLDCKDVYWQRYYSSEDDGGIRLAAKLSKALEEFHRKLLVIRVDEHLTIAIYIPKPIDRLVEMEIGKLEDSVKLFAFASTTGETFRSIAGDGYRLYYDGDVIQIFNKRRPDTFVWFALDNGKYYSKDESAEFKISIALQKFDGRFSRSRAKVTKTPSKGVEIYVISNRDRVGHQILDIIMNQVDTKKIVRLIQNIPREYKVEVDFEEVCWENREFCKSIIRTRKLHELREFITVCQFEQLYFICTAFAADEELNAIVQYTVRNSKEILNYPEVIKEMATWIRDAPSITIFLTESMYDSTFCSGGRENIVRFPTLENNSFLTLAYGLIQCANSAKELAFTQFQKLVQVMVQKQIKFSVDEMTNLVKWIIFCIRHSEIAKNFMDEMFNETTPIFTSGADDEECFKYFKHFTLALAMDYLGEVSEKCPCDFWGIPYGAEDSEEDSLKNDVNSYRSHLTNSNLTDFIPSKMGNGGDASAPDPVFRGTKPQIEMKCLEILPTGNKNVFTTILRKDVLNRIRNGDHLRFCASRRSTNKPNQRITVFDAIAESIKNCELKFKILHPEPMELYSTNWNVYICGSTTTFVAMLSAVKTLIDKKDEATVAFRNIIGLPAGESTESINSTSNINIPEGKFNQSQNEAVKEALVNPCTLIWGPPGTGKTTVVVEIILQFLIRYGGLRILVSASTHNAVDNVMERFIEERKKRFNEFESNDCVRVATEPSKVSTPLKKWTLDAFVGANIQTNDKAKGKATKRLKEAKIVFSTCSGAGVGLLRSSEVQGEEEQRKKKKKQKAQKFDIVIVDEASQITEPNALIPIVKCSKFVVLVGDHVQLRPTVSQVAKDYGLETSLFDKLYTSSKTSAKKIMLNVQYRMHPDLASFPSKKFYDGKLLSGVPVEKRILVTSKFPWPQRKQQGKDEKLLFPVVFVDCSADESNGSASKENQGQAAMIVQVIKSLQQDCWSAMGITVLSPYSKQVTLVKKLLSGAVRGVEVSTIDGFQGRENDIIIFSTVRCNRHNSLGFLDDHRRMNVALTRARYGLIIIGHEETLKSNELWRDLVQNCEKVDFKFKKT